MLAKIYGLEFYQKVLKMGELGVFCRKNTPLPLDVFEDICPRSVIHGVIFMRSKDLILVFKMTNGRLHYAYTNGTRVENLKIV